MKHPSLIIVLVFTFGISWLSTSSPARAGQLAGSLGTTDLLGGDPIACCLPNGCMELSELDCTSLGGTPLAPGLLCSDNDTDGDGTPDACDECPDDPEKVFAGDCGCGLPEIPIDLTSVGIFGSIGSGDGQFSQPAGIALDGSGRIYVSDFGNSRVQVFDAAGAFLASIGDGQLGGPVDVAVDPAGRVFVLELFNSRISVFDNSGVLLFTFGSVGSGDGQFIGPYGIDVDSLGRIWVLDTPTDRVQVFDSTGNFLFDFGGSGTGDGQFFHAQGLAIDSSDRVYVTDFSAARVQVFDSAGSFLSAFGSGVLSSPVGIEIDLAGRVYVAGSESDELSVFDETGIFLFSIDSTDSGDGSLGTSWGLALDVEGRVHVSDLALNRFQMFDPITAPCPAQACCLDNGCMQLDPNECTSLGGTSLGTGTLCTGDSDGDGTPDACDECPDDPEKVFAGDCGCGLPDVVTDLVSVGIFGSAGGGDGQFNEPTSIALDGSGRIYVSDYFNDRVQVFDAAGTFLASIGDGQLDGPVDVTIDPAGRVYVTDSRNHRVLVFDNSGILIFTFGSLGTGDGQFVSPTGIDLDSLGRIWVVDLSNDRVQVFDSTGNFLFNFGSPGTGNGQFTGAFGIAIDSSDRVYVTDFVSPRVQVFDSSGSFLFGFGSGVLGSPKGIEIDLAGRVYVAEDDSNELSVFDETGTFLFSIDSTDSGDGPLDRPSGLALDVRGRVYLSERRNHRVQMFDPVTDCTTRFDVDGFDAPPEVTQLGYVRTTEPGMVGSASNGSYVPMGSSNGVTVSATLAGPSLGWRDRGVPPYFQTTPEVVRDFVFAEGTEGAEIQVTISGLAAGTFDLTSYHHDWLVANRTSPFDILVDDAEGTGRLAVDNAEYHPDVDYFGETFAVESNGVDDIVIHIREDSDFQAVRFNGITIAPSAISSIDEVVVAPMSASRLLLAAPNPFQESTGLRFELSASEYVSLEVFDVAGRRVSTLVNGEMVAGNHEMTWDGTDALGRVAAPGIYFIRLQAGAIGDVVKVILVK